jgi:hypothetical protein
MVTGSTGYGLYLIDLPFSHRGAESLGVDLGAVLIPLFLLWSQDGSEDLSQSSLLFILQC